MGAAVDKDTRAGFGLGVISNTKGFDEEVRFQAGKRFGVDFQNIPANFPPALIEVIKVDPSMDPTGDMIFETPPAPKNGEPISKSLTPNLFLLYERKTDQWTMRWKDEGAPSTNPSEVSARNKARRSAMTAARPKSTHTGFKATIGQVGPLEADKPIGERSTSLSGVVSDLTAEIDKSLVPPVQGTRGPIGSAVPDEDTENPPNEHETVALDAIVEEILSSMTGSNFVGEVAVSDESKTHDASEDGASVEDRLQAVVDQEQANGGKLDSIREPNNKSFDNSLRDFITNEEGYVPVAYDDHSKTRAAWTSKSTGDPTIGHGFNLKRPDARAMLKRVGADFDKVMARKQSLTKLQADHLYKLSVEPLVTLVRKKYAGANLGNHQIQALVSLAYNSRWNAEGPTLLGPKLSQAIANKDWIAAGFEIAHNSENVPDNIRRGIHLRRIKEATLFLGPSLAKQVTYLN